MRKRRRRRRVLLVASIVGVGIAAALAWLAYTGLQARSELQSVRAEVHTLRSQIAAGDLNAARATASSLRHHAQRARELTTGPVWAAAAAVPFFGDPLDTARSISTSVSRIAVGALPPLVDASSTLDPKTLRRPDGSFDLAPLEQAAQLLGTALGVMQTSVHQLEASSGSTWLGSVNSARSDLLGQLPSLVRTIQNADVAARTVPMLLGSDGPKSYLVSFQNEAELRGLGGLPGAFAILEADNGNLRFNRFEIDTTLTGVPAHVNFGKDYEQLYSSVQFASTLYADSNLSPHFPYAAQIWTDLWQSKTGQQLDGAITLDPTAISYLLAVTGPATMPDGTQVTAGNVVALTQQTTYDRFASNNVKRKQFLLDLARAVSSKLIDTKSDPTALVRAAAKAAGEHRLLIWTKDSSIESLLAPTPIAGQVLETAAPYAGLAINNEGANKLDYYLHSTLDWQSSGCGSSRDVTVTIRLTSSAPPNLPSYVAGAANRPKLPPAGTNRSYVIYYATQGSVFTGVTVNGQRSAATSGLERGHPAFGVVVDTAPGAAQTIVFHLKEPASAGAVVTRMQPMINPVNLTVSEGRCRS